MPLSTLKTFFSRRFRTVLLTSLLPGAHDVLVIQTHVIAGGIVHRDVEPHPHLLLDLVTRCWSYYTSNIPLLNRCRVEVVVHLKPLPNIVSQEVLDFEGDEHDD